MTIQNVDCSYMSFAFGLEKTTASDTEHSFETFLEKEDNVSTKIQSEKATARDSVKSNDNKAEDVENVNQLSEVTEKLPDEQKNENEMQADVTKGLASSEGKEPEEITLPEDVLAQILGILNEIVVALQHSFQTEEQQLLDSAEMIQFGVTDFFDTNRMKELFLQVKGAEASELLTDETLYNSLEDLQNMVSDILENSELYQLLEKEGFAVDDFDMKAFEHQITALVNGTKEEMTEDIEVVIDFDTNQQETESRTYEKSISQDADTNLALKEAVQSNSAEFETAEQNQSESSQGREQAGLFLQKLVDVSKESLTEGIREVRSDFNLYDIANQIIEQVKIHIRPENTKMEIQLNPEQLGKVELEISSKNGELSARMNVQNDQVKEAVESQMQVLRETLEAQGLKVENIEVTVAEFGFRFQDEQENNQQFQQKRNRSTAIDFDDADAEEQTFSDVSEVMKELNGNSVDYVA